MLLQRVDRLPSGPWHYEVKWDGFRMQVIKCSGQVRLLSRNGSDYTRRFTYQLPPWTKSPPARPGRRMTPPGPHLCAATTMLGRLPHFGPQIQPPLCPAPVGIRLASFNLNSN